MYFKLFLEKRERPYSYSTVQIIMPNNIKNKILDWSEKNIDDKLLVENENASGREDEPHVTVLYGLHTENFDKVKKVLKDIESFYIELKEISKFTSETHDVLKVTVESKELRDINKKLKNNLEYTSKFKDYQPHMTIAYVKKNSCDKFLGKRILSDRIKVDKLQFSTKLKKKNNFNLKDTK